MSKYGRRRKMNQAKKNDYYGGNESYRAISNGMQNLSGQLYCATNAIQANIVQVGNKIDTALRKCERVRVSRELGELTGGQVVAIDTFSDESKAVVAYLANLWGPCEAYRFEIDEDDWDCGIFGLYYKGSKEWIVGRIDKVESSSYLYNLFNRLGFKWHGKIPVSDAKRVLCEGYANKILMTKNAVGMSALAGWKNGRFQHSNTFPIGIPEGITNFPVHAKNFEELDLSEEMVEKYFKEMRRIKDEKDRLVVMIYPFLSMIASILAGKGNSLNFGLNFIKLSEFERDKICGWLQIFNRKFCTPMSADISEKEFAHELRTVKDECLILDCTEHLDESTYEKDKKRKRCRKVFRTILEDRKVSGRKSGPICAGVCTLSSRFQAGKVIYNIFVDDDWFKGEGEALEPKVMEGVFSAFVKFAENHMAEIEEIIAERYGWKDDRESMILRGSLLVERFWKSRGFNLIKAAGFQNPIDFGKFFEENSYDDEEKLEIFLHCFRKGIAHYEVVPKEAGKFEGDIQIYYDPEWLLIPTSILDKIVDKCGGRKFKLQILAKLKESKKLNTDSEGLSKRLVIAGERREVYQIKREFFNKPGCVDVIALGGGKRADRQRK